MIYQSPADLADLFQVSSEFVKAKARSGEWPSSHLGERTIRFSEEHVKTIQALIERKPVVLTRAQARAQADHVKSLLKSSPARRAS